MEPRVKIFDRRCRVTVDGFAVEGLRVGFTVSKDLTLNPNEAEIAIYNLSRSSRQRMHVHKGKVKVTIEAGYRDSPLILIFVGEMREAYSRPERDGSWVTILRAGDGDKALRASRRTTGTRPGVAVDRVVNDVFGKLGVGAGNLWQAIKDGKGMGEVLKQGFNGVGSAIDQVEKILGVGDLEMSLQDGELQVLKAGQVLSTDATLLAPDTGLEGSPEIDPKGTLTARVRIVPGVAPGYPVQFAHESVAYTASIERATAVPSALLERRLSAVYRVQKARYVGDTHGQDWSVALTCVDPRIVAEREARKKAAAAKASEAAAAKPAAVPP